MTTRQQWSQGLQWGACAWLGYLTVAAVRDASRWVVALPWFGRASLGMAAVYLGLLVMVAAGSRFSRGVAVAAIVAQAALGQSFGGEYGGAPDALFSARFMVGVVPLFPLAVWRVERPRLVLAQLAVGRWRAAWQGSGGVVAVLVAAGLLALNHAVWGVVYAAFYGAGAAARALPAAALPACLFAAAVAAGRAPRLHAT